MHQVLNLLRVMQLNGLTMRYKKYILFIIIIIISGCKKNDIKEVILARVGDEIITAKDFRYNYETGFSHLKKKPDPKRYYLEYMIKEKLLSIEGYQKGFDKSEAVKKYENELLNELLIEEVFTQEVGSKINITSEQIKDAITKSKVSWKMRYWFEPNEESAQAICLAMREKGYTEIIDQILYKNPEIPIRPKDLTTQYMTYFEIPEEVFEAVKDLPRGDISDPVFINGIYYIFQILDIKRDGITDFDYKNSYEKYRQILYYRQLKKDAHKYIVNLMEPKKLKFKPDAFNTMCNAYVEWKKSDNLQEMDFKTAVVQADNPSSELYKVKQKLNNPVLTIDSEEWLLKDVLNRNIWRSIKVNMEDKKSIRPKIADELALLVRNKYLLQIAEELDLKEDPRLQKELKSWRDKWVYKETRKYFTKKIKVDDEVAKEYLLTVYKDSIRTFENDSTYQNELLMVKRRLVIDSIRRELDKKVDSLRQVIPVWINEAVLDTITTVKTEKTHLIDLQVYKRSSNRMAVPIVDPAW